MNPVRDIMVTSVITTDNDKNAYDAARIMAEHKIGSLVVVRDGKPVGIVTERDLVRKVCSKDLQCSNIQLENIMSKPIISVRSDMPIEDVARIMSDNGIRRLVILESGKLVGIVTVSDLAKYVHTRSEIDKIIIRCLTH